MDAWCGIGAKVARLRQLCGSEGFSDVQLEAVLKSKRYDVERAAEHLLDHPGELPTAPGLPSEMARGDCSEHESLKRQRPGSSSEYTHVDEELRSGSGNSTASMQMAALMAALATAVITPITSLIAALPSQLAAAMRKHDEDEAVRIAAAAEETHLERQIQRCVTCTEIGKLDPFDYSATWNRIYCLDCQRYGYRAPGKHKHGMISWGDYEGNHAAEPLRGIKAREFYTVKHAVLQHARSGLHAWCEVHAVEAAAETRKAQSTGMICGRLVLQIIKEHDSERSYERRVAAQHAMGSDMGNKNHSWHFCRGLKKSMHDVMTSTIQTVLVTIDPATGRAPAFAALADKATVDRRTGQMHGTLAMIRGRLVALFLSVLIVKADGGGGDGLAQLQVDTYTGGKPLTLTADMMREQLTGQAYDGQYQGAEQRSWTGLSVPVHLAAKLGLNPDWVLSRCVSTAVPPTPCRPLIHLLASLTVYCAHAQVGPSASRRARDGRCAQVELADSQVLYRPLRHGRQCADRPPAWQGLRAHCRGVAEAQDAHGLDRLRVYDALLRFGAEGVQSLLSQPTHLHRRPDRRER